MNDKNISWFILAFAALNVVFLGGKRRAFGIFVAQLRHDFKDTSLTELNWIGDSYAALGHITTTLSTTLIIRFGRCYRLSQFIGAVFILISCMLSAYVPNPHWLFLTHTILHGIGSSAILSTIGLVVNEHFDKDHKYHILATTLISGGSIASIVFVQFYAYLIETFTWRVAFIILGLIYFFVNLSAISVFRGNVNRTISENDKNLLDEYRKVKPFQMLLVFLWLFDRVITSVVTYGMLLNLADFKHRSESSLQKSAFLTTLFAAGEASTYAIATVFGALTKNLLKDKLKYILTVSSFSMAILLVVWENFQNYEFLSLFLAFSSGFSLGPSITFLFPAGEEMTQLKGYVAYPLTLGFMGIGMILSPLLTASIAEKYTYKWFFSVQGFFMFIKTLVLILSTIIINKRSNYKLNRYTSLRNQEMNREEHSNLIHEGNDSDDPESDCDEFMDRSFTKTYKKMID